MNEYYKFPTTPHIILPQKETFKNDKVMPLDEIAELLDNEIVIEEKIDGANLGISFDKDGKILLQNRGSYLISPYAGQWVKLDQWLKSNQDLLFDVLMDRYILFGEWCYAVHSVYYDKLPDYFIGFDLFDKASSSFLSVKKRNDLMRLMRISVIHQYARGIFHLEELTSFLGKSFYGNEICEGIYIRWDEEEWLKKRAKLVRYDFSQNIEEHWSRKNLKRNQLKRNSPV